MMSSQRFHLESTLVSDIPLKLRSLTEEILQQQKRTDFARYEQVMVLETIAENIAVLIRSLHNYLLPIQKLPADVLRTVFDETDSPSKVLGKGNPNALPLSHVCRRWRDISIGHATLWNCFTMSNSSIQRNEIYLERSRSAPLTIAIDIADIYEDNLVELENKTMANLELISSHNQKIVSLRIDVPSSANYSLRFLDFAIPRLRQLHLKSVCPEDRFIRLRKRAPSCGKALLLPETLFQGCPALKSINFSDVSQSALKGLGNLTDILLYSEPQTRTTLGLSTLLDLLRRCPLLQSLEISCHEFHLDGNGGAVAFLPTLRKLHLMGTPSHRILSNIDAPKLLDVKIDAPTDTSSVGVFSENVTRSSITKHIHYLRVTGASRRGYSFLPTIIGYNDAKSLCFAVTDHKDFLLYISLLAQVPLENCTELEIQIAPIDPPLPTHIGRIYSNVYALKTLCITNQVYPALYLQPLVDDSTLCPELDTVILYVSQEHLDNTLDGVKTLVSARAAVGKVISIGHIPEGGNKTISIIWDRFCDENHIQRFEGDLSDIERRVRLRDDWQ